MQYCSSQRLIFPPLTKPNFDSHATLRAAHMPSPDEIIRNYPAWQIRAYVFQPLVMRNAQDITVFRGRHAIYRNEWMKEATLGGRL